MKQVAGRIKLELAQYREMEAFSQFASDLDASTQRLLNRGVRLTELLKQDQNAPLKIEEQSAVIFAGVRGYLDSVPVNKVRQYEKELLQELRTTSFDILQTIAKDKEVSKGTEGKLTALLDRFTRGFEETHGSVATSNSKAA